MMMYCMIKVEQTIQNLYFLLFQGNPINNYAIVTKKTYSSCYTTKCRRNIKCDKAW